MGPELVARVNWITLMLLVPVTLASAWIGGTSSAIGTVAGGLLSLGSLYWVSRGVRVRSTNPPNRPSEPEP